MKIMKRLVSILFAVLLLAAVGCSAFASSEIQIGVEPGQKMPDFTVPLEDGSTATLSELLKEKDLVVLNIFATWCHPCEYEFPDFEKTWQAHSDRMEIVAVSGDPDDTMEMISEYKASHGLTFKMGLAGESLDFLTITGYPTNIFVDKNGNVGFIKMGAFVSEGDFEAKVESFLSADYSGIPLASEFASAHKPQILIGAAVMTLLIVIGRWCLFRKAGKPGWHSLIPILSTCQEFSLGWSGWAGLLSWLSPAGAVLFLLVKDHPNWSVLASCACAILFLVLWLVESFKLSKAFGKGVGVGILLFIFRSVGRFILGVSRAKYRAAES